MPKLENRLIVIGKQRAVVWLFWEAVHCAVTFVTLICFVFKNTKSISGLRRYILDNYPNANFFVYIVVSTLLLYGTVLGCNIPLTFNKVPWYMAESPPFPSEGWQICFMSAIVIGLLNSILNFVAAFCPMFTCPDDTLRVGNETSSPKLAQDPNNKISDTASNLENNDSKGFHENATQIT